MNLFLNKFSDIIKGIMSGFDRIVFNREIISHYKNRPEGTRIKHSVKGNSIKMYDKQRTIISENCNERYLASIGALKSSESFCEMIIPI